MYFNTINIDPLLFSSDHTVCEHRYNWLLSADKLDLDSYMVSKMKKDICNRLVYVDQFMCKKNSKKMLALDIESLDNMLSTNHYYTEDYKWVADLLIKYATPENKESVKHILLPKLSVITVLSTSKNLTDVFELPNDILSLLRFQLEHGCIYDAFYSFNLDGNILNAASVYDDDKEYTFELDPDLIELYTNATKYDTVWSDSSDTDSDSDYSS